MKILNREQAYDADRATIGAQGIDSAELMERAATEIFDRLHQMLGGAPVPIHIFCGTGNNGGDGLAVARQLSEHGYAVFVFIVNYSKNRSPDFLLNLERLKQRKIWPETLQEDSPFPEIGPNDLVLDAVFGIGLNRAPDAWVRKLFASINKSGASTYSVDMPSGLATDAVPGFPDGVVRADCVLAIGAPKLVFFLPDTGKYVKGFAVLDIGFDAGFMGRVPARYELMGHRELRPLYRQRTTFAHKGTYGHAYVVGGSYGKIGAVNLAALACLRSGAGLVTAWVPQCGLSPIQSSIPAVMVQTGREDRLLTDFPDPGNFRVGVGMGMGTDAATARAFLTWLAKQKDPIVIDADALNILSEHPDGLSSLPAESILTPHPGELRRLIGDWNDDFEKLEKAHGFSSRHKCILVVKGAYSMVFAGERAWVNTSGNPGMATAGSGDVLAGFLTGLLAQGYLPIDAARLGVYLHGRAGDLAAAHLGYEALTAMDLCAHIGPAFKELLIAPAEPACESSLPHFYTR